MKHAQSDLPQTVESPEVNFAKDEDAILVSRLKCGDEKAVEEVVKAHAGWMLGVARRMTNCDADAADCVQESFEVLIQKIGKFEGRSLLKTWLHKVLINQSLMKIRKRSNLHEQPLEDYLPEFDTNGFYVGPVRISDESVEALISEKETCDRVRASIAQLPDTYRVILLLRDIEGFTSSETAMILDIEDSAVRTRLHRGRLALKKALESTLGPTYLKDLLG